MPFPAILGALGRVLATTGGSATNVFAGRAIGSAGNLLKTAHPIAPGPLTQAFGGMQSLGFATQGIRSLMGTVAGLGRTAISAVNPIGIFSKAINIAQSPLTGLVGSLTQFSNTVTGLGSQVSAFTQLANPALTQRFQFAADDFNAAIGRSLLPVLKLATKSTRAFADVIYSLSGPIQRFGNAFNPLVDLFPRITGMLSPLMGQVTKFIDETTAAIKPLITSAAELAATGLVPLIDE